jgi:crossover junction endodeoxyribonuclease RuvC
LIVLGIDPGSRHMGWGVIRVEGSKLAFVACGVVSPQADGELADRLLEIDTGLNEVLATYKPQQGSVESIFFAKDASAASKLGHARGVILLALRRAGVPFGEYAPTFVKRTVTGQGLAEKRQVALVVTAMLRLQRPPPADAADALALAITHARAGRTPQLALLARQAGR